MRNPLRLAGLQALLWVSVFLSVGAGVAGEAATPVSTADPQIPVAELELRLQPLTVDELRVEAQGWLDLLKAKVEELSNAEIAVQYKNLEIETAEQVQEAKEQAAGTQRGEELKDAAQAAREAEQKAKQDQAVQAATTEALKEAQHKPTEQGTDQARPSDTGDKPVAEKEDTKAKLLEHINTLRAERTALMDRLNAVVSAWEAKGGDQETIEHYHKYIAAVSGIKVDVSDTGAAWATLKGWFSSEQGGLRWAKNITAFVLIVLAFYLLSRLLGNATARAFGVARGRSTLLRDFAVNAVRRVTLLIGVIVGLGALEVNIGPLLAVIGAVGFVVALALQNSLGNFASGILILLYRPFDVDDVIEAGGVAGKVESMNLLSTHIKTFDNKSMILPNNSVWGGVITNATGTDKRRVDMVFGIGYEDSIPDALRLLEEIVAEHALVLKDPAPTIKLHELGDSSVDFICRPWVRPADYWTVYWDITRAVKERFDAQGISIPYPQRDIHVYNETPALSAAPGHQGAPQKAGRGIPPSDLDHAESEGRET